MLKKIFTKEILINMGLTLVVVTGALIAYDQLIKPAMSKKNASTPAPTQPTVASTEDGE